LTSSTKSSGGKLLGISGNEETGNAVPDTGNKRFEFLLLFFFIFNILDFI